MSPPPAQHRSRRLCDGFWTWHRLHSDSPAYNVRPCWVRRPLRPAVPRAALADLTDRHERSRAVTEPAGRARGGPDDVAVPLSVEVVRDGDGGWAADLDRALRRLADQPFAMDTRPCGGWSHLRRRSAGASWC